ncbi:alpha/beta hydrolase family protein [Nonomuraea rhodomycinica]|uniref:Alpha/beta hydrolase fold domain-containing protein n=1 Tax=Nonomuraea rhodomycinica TaxID=1712872 RepID=A0A7Y6M8Q9_9ACTN|nr:alpha/beta hydrolase [Nonomuraea rhodomycinica]NUW38822.1 alpha/beta hydrolase fold domain-containing protein [Nonomuraea rhodomycinica]
MNAAGRDAAGQDAADQDAAEQASAFSHPYAEPDATVCYGGHPDQLVDLYAPRGGPLGGPAAGPGSRAATAPSARPGTGGLTGPGAGRAPLVVVLHGGAWRAAYDRRHVSPFAAFLARRGLAVASVEYRRGGAAPGAAGRWPETFDDVAAALDALPALAADALPGVDTSRVVLTGHSAGGHLALWAAARHRLPPASPWRLPGPSVAGVVALAPIADLVRARELAVCSDAALQLLGGPDRFEERRPSADPAVLLPAGVPTTIVHGRDDVVVPVEVSASYARSAAAAGRPVRLTLVADAGHFPLIDPAADACAVVAEEVTRVLTRP